jgi:uncharacterized protein (TIGR02646 family)
MHKLDRNSVSAPTCIVPHNPARRYQPLHGAQKEEIRTALLNMQRERCAYCERRTGTLNDEGHIEHFQNQAGHEELETDWNNLFWSCLDERTCGKHKDKCDMPQSPGPQRVFELADIIKPCTDDPDHFMMFISNGTIAPRENLSVDELRRYSETLRVFQLADSPFLRKSREDAVKPYIGSLVALCAAGPEFLLQYIASELDRLDSVPFATAIRHFLQSNQP